MRVDMVLSVGVGEQDPSSESSGPPAELEATRLDPGPRETRVGEATSPSDSEPPSQVERLPAERIGDYFVLERVGAGAMGTVYAAYDPELDRKVAIKVLKQSHEGDSVGRLRLQREARALARLDHPNVVSVHGVGVHEGHAWVAMAFVDGEDLASWRVRQPRSWREVFEVYLKAGRGLAAAHAAGVVHRDFKPGNVLISGSGRVMVADFGLARPSEEVGAQEDESSIDAARDDASARLKRRAAAVSASSWTAESQSLTVTQGVVGTPMYMAPEQHMGSRVGPAADQYAYCLAFYEALYGELPFDTSSMFALLEAKNSAQVRAAPNDVDVPRWLRRLLIRGLAVDPAKRYPDMAALVAEAERGLRGEEGRSVRRMAMTGGALAVLAAGVGGWWVAGSGAGQADAAPVDPCADAASPLEEVWNDDVRDRLRSRLAEVDAPFAADVADEMVAQLDAHAAAVADAHVTDCRAQQTGKIGATVAMMRDACLQTSVSRVELVLEVLASPDRASLMQGGELLDRTLADPDRCQEAAWTVPARTPEAQEERRELTAQVARVYAYRLGGRPEEAAEIREALEAKLDAVTDPMARGEIRRMAGNARPLNDDTRTDLLSGALADAVRSRNYALAVMVTLDLAPTHAEHQRLGEALRVLEQGVANWEAMAITGGWGEDPPPLAAATRANLDVVRGDVLKAMGRPDEAISAIEAGLERWREVEAFSAFKVNAQNNLAEALREVGRHEEAFALYDAALETTIAEVGEKHPRVATILNNRGGARIELGQYSQGVADLERGRAIQVDIDGEAHPNIALIDYNLAIVDLQGGDLKAARTRLDRAMRIWAEKLPPGHPFAAVGRMSQGTLARYEGELDAAGQLGHAAVDGLMATVGPEHPLTATALAELALTLAERKDAAAVETAERAVKGFEASAGLETPNAANAFLARAEARIRTAGPGQAQLDAAIADYERAAKIFTETGSPEHPELSWPYLGLAECALKRDDPEDARAWANRARAAAAGGTRPKPFKKRLAAVDAAL